MSSQTFDQTRARRAGDGRTDGPVARRPPGSPQGGQFAPQVAGEADVELDHVPPVSDEPAGEDYCRRFSTSTPAGGGWVSSSRYVRDTDHLLHVDVDRHEETDTSKGPWGPEVSVHTTEVTAEYPLRSTGDGGYAVAPPGCDPWVTVRPDGALDLEADPQALADSQDEAIEHAGEVVGEVYGYDMTDESSITHEWTYAVHSDEDGVPRTVVATCRDLELTIDPRGDYY